MVAQERILPGVAPAAIDEVFNEITKTSPGCIATVDLAGKRVLEKGYGLASLEYRLPITPASVFNAASISKQFTAASVALLVHDGKLSWDDDIHKYVPELANYGHTLTLRMLAGHISGFRDPGDLFALAGVRNVDPVSEKDALRMLLRQRHLNFVPGTQYQYSNANFMLLKLVVERVAGKSLQYFTSERIFGPLGMQSSHFQKYHGEIIQMRAFPYQAAGDGGWRLSLPVWDTLGPTGMVTTASDLMRWQRNFVDGKVGRDALAELAQPGRLANGEATGYGLGLEVSDSQGLISIGHSGGDAGISTGTYRYPAQDLAVAVLCNYDANATAKARALANLYLGGALGKDAAILPAITPVPVEPDLLERYAGIYRNPVTNDIRKLVVKDGRLIYARGIGTELQALSRNRFRFPSSPTLVEIKPVSGPLFEMLVTPPGQAPIRYVQERPIHDPTPKQLLAYAGRYYSSEIDAVYVITIRNGALFVHAPRGDPFRVQPAFSDAFVAGDFLMRFRRDRVGRISGFLADQVRVRNLRFVRTGQAAVERVYGRLKDEFGGRYIRVRGLL